MRTSARGSLLALGLSVGAVTIAAPTPAHGQTSIAAKVKDTTRLDGFMLQSWSSQSRSY